MITPLKAAVALAAAFFLEGAASAQVIPPLGADDSAPADSSAPTPKPDAPASNPYNMGTTSDGRTIVAPGTYGPFQGPTCVAGGDCTAATNNSLEAIGELQQKDANAPSEGTRSVMKSEDGMLANGTYAKIDRDNPDNPGQALITLPDGSVFISDYKKGFDTLPKKPEELANDASQPSWVRMKAQAIVDAKAAKDADKKGFGITSTGDKGTKSAATPPPTEAGASDTGGEDQPAPSPTDNASGSGPTDLSGMGGMIADNFGSSGGPGGSSDVGGDTGSGSGGSSGGGSSNLGSKANAATRQMMEQLNNADLSYTHNQDFANSQIMTQLRKDASMVPSKANGADETPQADSSGTNFFRGK